MKNHRKHSPSNRPNSLQRGNDRRRTKHLAPCSFTNKHRFRTERAANNALRQAEDARLVASYFGAETNRQEKRAYHCKACDGWHLTSKGKHVEPPGVQGLTARSFPSPRAPIPPALLKAAEERRRKTDRVSDDGSGQ